jgi:N-acylneuraminate cytidylyltransferase
MSNKIAIIPARSGSKRVKNKNIVEFLGKPLISYTIEAAIKSKLFSKVIVSTDDEKIANISMKYGAEVPFLRQEYEDDYSPVSLATIHTLQQAETYYRQKFSTVVQLFSVCPLRDATDIVNAVGYFVDKELDFSISCSEFPLMTPWWGHTINENKIPKSVFPEALKKRSQDLEKMYCPSGAIWIANREKLIESKSFYGKGHAFFPLSWQSAIDIDTQEDLELAELFYQKYRTD